MIFPRGNMSSRQVATANAPAKRQSKNWVHERTRGSPVDDHANELTTESSITKNARQSRKQSCKCSHDSRINCATMLRAFNDHSSTQVTHLSGSRFCQDPSKEKRRPASIHTRELVIASVKSKRSAASEEPYNICVVAAMSGDEAG